MRTRTASCTRAALVLVAVVGLLPVLVATAPAGAATAPPTPGAGATGLESFADCGSLLTHLKAVASAKVGPYGFGNARFGVFDVRQFQAVGATAASDEASGPLASTESSSGGSDVSQTNNQEVGVDEADTVKTDGTRMVIVQGDTLTTIDVRNAAKPVRRAELSLGGTASNSGDPSMLLSGDRALVLIPRWKPFAASGSDAADYGPYLQGEPVTDAVMVSIADLTHPRVLDRVTLDGTAVATRLVGGAARVVVDSVPLDLAFVTPQSSRGAAAALATNRQIIDQSTIADWLPQLRRGRTTTPAVDCQDVRTPAEFAGAGMTTIHTIAMADRIDPASVSLQADSDTAYASTDHLYVTAAAWVDPTTYDDPRAWERLATSYATDVHEFAITGPQATYVASGRVRGHPLSQWALSDQDGRLRIATTDGPTWGRPEGTRGPTSESFMSVLAPDGGALRLVGRVGGIGKGESIRAVRYDGNTAYVVTFRQVDPFYVLDLSDPARPAVVGQLKIAGYSGYLHPVGAGRVLGVGADANLLGQITGARVTLFDVSDLHHPKALSVWTLAGSHTNVEFDAKAFLWWAPSKLAVVPMFAWGPFATNGAIGLRVTNGAITPVKVISHARAAERGRTACRRLTGAEITKASQNFGPSSVVIDCAPGQPVTVVGYFCSAFTPADFNEQTGSHFRVPADHHLGFCFPSEAPMVLRSFVVRDRLLTLTDHDLLSSDLATLAPGPFVDF